MTPEEAGEELVRMADMILSTWTQERIKVSLDHLRENVARYGTKVYLDIYKAVLIQGGQSHLIHGINSNAVKRALTWRLGAF